MINWQQEFESSNSVCHNTRDKTNRTRPILLIARMMTDRMGEFRILGRPRTSACFCAKARLMRVTSHQEDKQT